MNPTTAIDPLGYTLAISAGLLLFLPLGHKLGSYWNRSNAEGISALNGIVYALLGLLLGFAFFGAATRFDERRALILAESNAIGTAYLRLDLLPSEAQPALRELFRAYVQARLDTYRDLGSTASETAYQHSLKLQQQIWQQATNAARAAHHPGVLPLMAAALNEMIDITTSRLAATRNHPPMVIYLMLYGLAMVSALLAGISAADKPLPWPQSLLFIAALALALYVIIDLEYPRHGLIRVDASDLLLRETLNAMQPVSRLP